MNDFIRLPKTPLDQIQDERYRRFYQAHPEAYKAMCEEDFDAWAALPEEVRREVEVLDNEVLEKAFGKPFDLNELYPRLNQTGQQETEDETT